MKEASKQIPSVGKLLDGLCKIPFVLAKGLFTHPFVLSLVYTRRLFCRLTLKVLRTKSTRSRVFIRTSKKS